MPESSILRCDLTFVLLMVSNLGLIFLSTLGLFLACTRHVFEDVWEFIIEK